MTTSTRPTALPAEVEAWLARGLPEAVPPFRVERITGGYSMLTSRVIDSAGQVWVLRQPPRGQAGGGAHDPDRESRTMSALWETDVPVPRVRMTGTAEDPLGVPCHVTDFVDGFVVTGAAQAEQVFDAATLRVATTNLTTALAALHAVDPETVGLADLGPKENYNGRQIRRWGSILAAIAETASPEVTQHLAALRALGDVLARRLPTDTAGRLVHGDYRLGNTITAPDGTIRAILDWELVTRGEPLADLGSLLVFWDAPAEAMLGTPPPTTAPGSLRPDEVVETYVAATGASVDDLPLYRSLASWRLACLCLRTAVRFRAGAMGDDTDSGAFLRTTDLWAERAAEELS
ncbi:phosphotransferase family protein [Mumia zhuanghuii]|uniref:Phosphotransferase family protein n=2 Tax=Mumia TaxID=1546255 RepID=A0ABW1QH51_9ACTN|nr:MULTISPECIES: phosphotransferase family protein [Mumia]KAA1423056.1 phosphotransferase family protein [Mumia zhuanghuii]